MIGLLKKFFKLLKNPVVLGLVILIATALIVWFVGPLIAFGGNVVLESAVSRLVVIMVLLLIWSTINLILYARSLKNKAAQPAKAETVVAETEAVPPPTIEDAQVAQLRRSFNAVSRFTRKTLAWHLVIGNAGSGKTTLLEKSTAKFEFPENKKLSEADTDIPDVCSWHLTKEKVFLELYGQALQPKSEVWRAVLAGLRRYRHKNPLKGLTIVCSVEELIQKSSEQRRAYAGILRQCIYDLHRSLGIQIPVMLVFNKADLIVGFKEFFEHFTEKEKQQIWGIKFSSEENLADQFTTGFNNLIGRLNERLLERLQHEPDTVRAAIISDFPLQLAALKAILHDFVQNIVVSAKFAEPVHLFGTYFASSLQERRSVDLLEDSVIGTFDLEKSEPKTADGRSNITYFTTHVFDMFVPSKKVEYTNQTQRKQKRNLIWGSILGGLVLIFFTLFWYSSYNDAVSKLANLNQTLSASPDVEQWRQLNEDFVSWQQGSWFAGLYYPKKVIGSQLHDAYVAKLQQQFIPSVFSIIEQSLRTAVKNNKQVYPVLKIYLMFAYPQHMDSQVVQAWMANYWQRTLLTATTSRERLNSELSDALSKPLQPMTIDNGLVSDARNSVLKLSIAEVAYMNLVQQIQDENIDQLVLTGDWYDEFTQVFTSSIGTPKISKFYTPDGYNKMYKPQYLAAFQETLQGDWVIGTKQKTVKITDAMKEQMKGYYFQDYINQWNQILSKIHIVQCQDMTQLLQVLNAASGPSSPLMQLIDVANTNTRLSGSFLQNKKFGKKSSKTGAVVQKAESFLSGKATPVDKAFSDLHQLSKANIQKTLQATYAYMQTLNSPDVAFKAAVEIMSNNAQNPIIQLLQQADQAPAPVNTWLKEIAQQCVAVIMEQARTYIRDAWATNVYQPYSQTIAGQYPLVKDSSQEISLADFAAFFGPKGTVGVFYQKYFAPFVQQQDKTLVWNSVVGQTIGFSNTTMQMLQNLVYIQNAFFADGAKLGINFTMTPLTLSGNAASVNITIGGEHLVYKHGPRFPSNVSWPAKDSNTITINFTGIQGQVGSTMEQGDWGLFRLLDKHLKSGRAGQASVLTLEASPYSATYTLQVSSAYNPFNLNVLHGLKLLKLL